MDVVEVDTLEPPLKVVVGAVFARFEFTSVVYLE